MPGNNNGNTVEKIQERGVLVVATSPDYAPMEFLDTTNSTNGEPVGSDIELAKYIAEKMGVELKIETMDFTSVLTAVSTGNADIAISGFGWKADREESFELSIGYNVTDSCHGLIVRTADYNQYNSLSDFAGKTVAAQVSSLQEGYVLDQLTDSKLESITSLDTGILMLQTNKVDAFACSCELAKAYAQSYEGLSFAEPQFVMDEDDSHEGNVVAVAKGSTELIAYINDLLTTINEDGTYKIWYDEAVEYAKSIGIEFVEE